MSAQKHKSTLAFFEEELTKAAHNQNYPLTPTTRNYLATTLSAFTHSASLFNFDPEEGKRSQPTLAFLYHNAMNAPSASKARVLFQRLGDVALFTAGFFAESLQRKIIAVDYYENMGRTGYGFVAARADDKDTYKLFSELSQEFSNHLNLVSEISERSFIEGNSDVLRLYEKWLKTGNIHIENRLRELGLVPLPARDKPESKN